MVEKVADLQLAPVIWVLILGLLFVFVNKVRRLSTGTVLGAACLCFTQG